MNKLNEEFESKGLSIVGVTSETQEKTEPWIEKQKAAYPYAYDKKRELSRGLKVSGIPAAFLVNPRGKVVWSGHPSGLNASIIEEHIKGASKMPPGIDGLTSDWPKSALAAKKLLAKNKVGKALTMAQKLAVKDQGCQVAVDLLTRMAQNEVDGVKELREAGDLLGALDTAKEAKKTLNGCDMAKRIDVLVKEIKASKGTSKILSAQRQLGKFEVKIDDIRKRKDAKSMLKKLDKFIAKNADTYPGRRAEDVKAALVTRMEKLRR